LDHLDQFRLAIFRGETRDGAFVVYDGGFQGRVNAAAIMCLFKIVSVLFRHPVPEDLHHLVEGFSDGFWSVIIGLSGGGDEEQEATENDRHQEADQEESKENAQAASRLANGPAAAEQADDGDNSSQCKDEQGHVVDILWNASQGLLVFAANLHNHMDETLVDLSPYSNPDEEDTNEPKHQIEEEKQVLRKRRAAHLEAAVVRR